VVFEVFKTKERQAIDAKLRDREKQLDLFDVRLRPDTFEKANELTPGWDVYMPEAEWREGAQRPGSPPGKPDGAFLGFCEQRGRIRVDAGEPKLAALYLDCDGLCGLSVPSEDVREVIGISGHVPDPMAEPSVCVNGLDPFV
jgi:hypothetical protein